MIKRIICGLYAAIMLVSAIPIPTFADNSASLNTLILWYDFSDGVKDASGNGNDGENMGVEISGGKATFDGKSSYIVMPKGLLKDCEAATVSVTFKNDTEDNCYKWLWAFGDGIDNNFYFDPCTPDGNAVAATKINGGSEAQLVYSDGCRKSSGNVTVTVVADGKNSAFYVNGELVRSGSFNISPCDLGETPLNYIGRSFWSGDALFKGEVSDFKIYNTALSESAVILDYAMTKGDDEKVVKNLQRLLKPKNLSRVMTDIPLKSAEEDKDGFSLSWESSSPEYISDTGKLLKRPKTGSVDVVLKMKLTYKGENYMQDVNATVCGLDTKDYTLTIKNKKINDIQSTMWGLFFEDISRAADGGLYAEMLYNRSFECMKSLGGYGDNAYSYEPGYRWKAIDGSMTYATDAPLNENNTHYLEFSGKSFENQAYDGIYLEKGKSYNVSFYARSDSYNGKISAAVLDADGRSYGEVVVAEKISANWEKYSAVLKATDDIRGGRFVITLENDGEVCFDMFSMMPEDAVFGVLRADLVEMLKAMKPGFMRFPGGCIVEGYIEANHYDWKASVGPVEQRKENLNRWAIDQWSDERKYYNQSYGLGYYEYFLLCEYLECEAVPVLPVGIGCQYQGSDVVPIFEADGVTYTQGFKARLDDALDLIEFANSTDFENSKWARLRRDMGHEEPFGLTMIAIGNEQWETEKVDFFARYTEFEKVIHEKYPDIKLLGSAGPSAGGEAFDKAWAFSREGKPTNVADDFVYAVDEHYYCEPDWFINNVGRYDNYDRKVKVFAGEYASRVGDDANTLHTALTEAAFMTGLERNSDVVYMCSYAPLFARVGWENWGPDLIWFDEASVYGSPDYYEQMMFSTNKGDYTLVSELETYSDEELYTSAAYEKESGDVIIKIVNLSKDAKSLKLDLNDFGITGSAVQTILTHDDLYAKNSIESPENCVAVTNEISFENGEIYSVPKYSFVVLRVHTKNSPASGKAATVAKALGVAAIGAAAIAAGVVAVKKLKGKDKK